MEIYCNKEKRKYLYIYCQRIISYGECFATLFFLLSKEMWHVWRKVMAMFQVVDGNHDTNVTYHISDLVPVFRRVRGAHTGGWDDGWYSN